MNTPPPSDDSPALDALFSAARAARPDTSRAEYGFETRLLARLSAGKQERGGWIEFTSWCWRLVPAFAAITLATVLWPMWPGTGASADQSFLAATVQPLPADEDRFAQWLAVEWLTPI